MFFVNIQNTAAQSTTLFSDGFESGDFSSWTGTSGLGTYTQSVTSTQPIAGLYSANFTVQTQDGASYAYRTNFAVDQQLVLQFIVRLDGLPPTSLSQIVLGGLYSLTDGQTLQVILRNNGGSLYWGVQYGVYMFEATPSTVLTNTDYNVTVVLDKQNSQGSLYVNGAQKILVSKIWTQSTYDALVGIVAANMDVGSGLNVYVDNVSVASVELPPPTPTPTPSPSPTPTLSPSGSVFSFTMAMSATVGEVPGETNVNKILQVSRIDTNGVVYGGSFETLYKSTDEGATWIPLLTFNGSIPGIIDCVYVNKQHYIFVSPDPSTTVTDELGIWRSTNGGATWSKVMYVPVGCSVISMTEDTNGNLFTGIYTVGDTGNASICKSTDGGATWSTVFYNSGARHVHDIVVDPATNYIYASIGDDRVEPVWHSYVVRATDGGDTNSSWQKIFDTSQILAIGVIDGKAGNGATVPAARLFATDLDNGIIYRTTDDQNFQKVLDDGGQSYGFWIRTSDTTGNTYASFVCGDANPGINGIYLSQDNGLTWSLYKTFTAHTAYYGSGFASNFYQGIMYYSVRDDSGWHNAIRLYTGPPSQSGQTALSAENSSLNPFSQATSSANSTSVSTISDVETCFSATGTLTPLFSAAVAVLAVFPKIIVTVQTLLVKQKGPKSKLPV